MSSTEVAQDWSVQPNWHREALTTRPSVDRLRVDGVDIKYQVWESSGPARWAPIVLIHGAAAHQGWWNHIAPLLAKGRRVATLDLSGHGDSGWRRGYTHRMWAHEALAVAEHVREAGRAPILIGHSMGGYVAIAAGGVANCDLGGVVTIDSPFAELTAEERRVRSLRAIRGSRVFATREEAVARFRPLPQEENGSLPAYVVAPVAAASVRRAEDGWVWKLDPVTHDVEQMGFDEITAVECRAAVLRGEFGMVDEVSAQRLRERLGRHTDLVELAQAGHNVMLDQPLALVGVLRTLLATWRT